MKKTLRITKPERFFGIIAFIFSFLALVIFFLSTSSIAKERNYKLFLVKQEILEYLGETEMSYEEIQNCRIAYHDSENWNECYNARCTFSYDGRSIEVPKMFWNSIEQAINPEISFEEFAASN